MHVKFGVGVYAREGQVQREAFESQGGGGGLACVFHLVLPTFGPIFFQCLDIWEVALLLFCPGSGKDGRVAGAALVPD